MEKRPVARRLMTHPGVGVLTAPAFELVIGTAERFHCGKQIASYVGLVPSEESSAIGGDSDISANKATPLVLFLLVEAAQVTVRSQPERRSKFFQLAMRRGPRITKVGDGKGTRGSPVLDVAWGMGLRAVEEVWFARGTARTSPWCAVEHRAIDWVSRFPSRGSSK